MQKIPNIRYMYLYMIVDSHNKVIIIIIIIMQVKINLVFKHLFLLGTCLFNVITTR